VPLQPIARVFCNKKVEAQILHIHFLNYIKENLLATTNVAIAAIAKKAVLKGVKEHVALYPSRQSLPAFKLGIKVLMAAMLRTIITKTETIVNAFKLFHLLLLSNGSS
jgi:hypothetical protein